MAVAALAPPRTRMREWCRENAHLSAVDLRRAVTRRFGQDRAMIAEALGRMATLERAHLGSDGREQSMRAFRQIAEGQTEVSILAKLAFWTENIEGVQVSILECTRLQLLDSLEARRVETEGRIRHETTLERIVELLPNDTTTLGGFLRRNKSAQTLIAGIIEDEGDR